MEKWIDFKQLRAKLNFAEVLAHYRTTVKIKGDQAQGFCSLPTHVGIRNSPSFSVNLKRGIWQCFGCGAKGNLLDFAIRMENLSPDSTADVRTVALKLQGIFKIENTVVKPKAQAQQTEPLFAPVAAPPPPPVKINEPLDFELKGLQLDHPYLTSRGFSTETIRYFGLGYCARGLMAGRVVIPLHDTHSRLVGYAGRLVDDSAIGEDTPKYRFPSQRERNKVVYEFRKSHILYNAHRIKGTVDRLIVVEGFPSVWWLHQAGFQNSVALMGWSCSEEQAAIIRAVTSVTAHISLLTDGDEAGDRCAQCAFAALGQHRWVRWIRLADSRQPTDCRRDELEQHFGA